MQVQRPGTLLKRDSNKDVFLWILWNFYKQLFYKTPLLAPFSWNTMLFPHRFEIYAIINSVTFIKRKSRKKVTARRFQAHAGVYPRNFLEITAHTGVYPRNYLKVTAHTGVYPRNCLKITAKIFRKFHKKYLPQVLKFTSLPKMVYLNKIVEYLDDLFSRWVFQGCYYLLQMQSPKMFKKKLFLKFLQNPQETTCAEISF